MREVIKGQNIILRPQEESDATYFARWFSEPDVMFKCGFEAPISEDEMKTVISVNHRREDSLWYTITDLDGRIIGEIGLLRMFPAWHCTDLSIIIPDPENRRKGYGSEAIRIMLDMAFKHFGMNRVSIGVVGLNAAALSFYKKIGFRQEGIQQEGYFYNGEFSDFVMMRILKREWT